MGVVGNVGCTVGVVIGNVGGAVGMVVGNVGGAVGMVTGTVGGAGGGAFCETSNVEVRGLAGVVIPKHNNDENNNDVSTHVHVHRKY